MSIEFHIEPNIGALPIRFGMTAKEVAKHLGKPDSEKVNFEGNRNEYRANKKVRIGFAAEKEKVRDLSFSPDKNLRLFFQDVDLLSDSQRFEALLKGDNEPQESMGFLVFFKIGVAVTGYHDGDKSQRAITVFAKGAFDDIRNFKPYDVAKLRKLKS